MNKYEEAISVLSELVESELVEKATPKKLAKSDDSANIYCPSCHLAFYPHYVKQGWVKYCPNCGQKLDWREVHE